MRQLLRVAVAGTVFFLASVSPVSTQSASIIQAGYWTATFGTNAYPYLQFQYDGNTSGRLSSCGSKACEEPVIISFAAASPVCEYFDGRTGSCSESRTLIGTVVSVPPYMQYDETFGGVRVGSQAMFTVFSDGTIFLTLSNMSTIYLAQSMSQVG